MSIGMMAPLAFFTPWIPMQISSAKQQRSLLLDAYRGSAVLLMIIFHFCWDLRNFGFVEYQLNDPFWVNFRSLILTLFFTALGWSAYLAQQSRQRLTTNTAWYHGWRREGKLLLCALAISGVTFIAFPQQWIYFGILHFILLASLWLRPLLNYPVAASFIGSIIVLSYYHTDYLHFPNAFNFISGYINLPRSTLDIVFPFPWLGVVLFGPLFGYLKWQRCTISTHVFVRFLALLGRHALAIYLLHQLFLFALVASAKTVLDWLF